MSKLTGKAAADKLLANERPIGAAYVTTGAWMDEDGHKTGVYGLYCGLPHYDPETGHGSDETVCRRANACEYTDARCDAGSMHAEALLAAFKQAISIADAHGVKSLMLQWDTGAENRISLATVMAEAEYHAETLGVELYFIPELTKDPEFKHNMLPTMQSGVRNTPVHMLLSKEGGLYEANRFMQDRFGKSGTYI